MKLAFTSCMSTEVFTHRQPVWEDIARQDPDVLVLLGDSIYIDCPMPSLGGDNGGAQTGIGAMTPYAFANHVHGLYRTQLAVPEFLQLINRPKLRTFAIWDDHDFLWNDAGQSQALTLKEHTAYSSNLFQCWRDALAKQTAFPLTTVDARVNRNIGLSPDAFSYDRAMPGYQSVVLQEGGPVLHLTDGRSWRTRKTLLGTTQRAQMEAVLARHPDALHIVASGSTFDENSSSGWVTHDADASWLRAMATRFNLLLISGDIHRNRCPTPKPCGARSLREFTSSGAAVDFAPTLVPLPSSIRKRLRFERHFGMLTLQGNQLEKADFFHLGQMDPDCRAAL